MVVTDYSICENMHGHPCGPWHIRALSAVGKKLGGGADTLSLCGRKMTWDRDVIINERQLSVACKKCVDLYRQQITLQS